ncbi:putative lipoprotein [Burkholderia sp. H160]|nr:putative lipoprotein [Burkholderia sp. H160]
MSNRHHHAAASVETPAGASLRRAALACLSALVLGGCLQPWQQYSQGADVSTVVARLGPPRETYDLPDGGKRLMWPTQPMGETTTAADIDAAGKIVNMRQVLQPNEFYRAEIGKWTRSDVLVNFGRPVETSYFPMMRREVWTYRYLEDNVWYMLYSFYFDDQGILRLTQKTPDPLHEPDRRSLF